MSRPIKFRVWDTENAKMLPWEEIWYSVLNVPEAMVGGGVPWIAFLTMAMIAPDTKYVAEQWTGLLDSKGVEIYEGDIVQSYLSDEPDPSDQMVIEHRWIVTHISDDHLGSGFYAQYTNRARITSSISLALFRHPDDSSTCRFFKVIGNIHQHPELLKT